LIRRLIRSGQEERCHASFNEMDERLLMDAKSV
jgi:hypothetical protein